MRGEPQPYIIMPDVRHTFSAGGLLPLVYLSDMLLSRRPAILARCSSCKLVSDQEIPPGSG